MKRFGKLFLLVVIALSLFISIVAVSVSARPVHVGGGPRLTSSSPVHVGGGFTTRSTPVHVGGG